MTFQIEDSEKEIFCEAIGSMNASQLYVFMKLVNCINDSDKKITELINIVAKHDSNIEQLSELKQLVDLR